MGEPTPQTYKRHFEFPFWPVESASELADYAEWLIDLVRHESGVKPEVKLDINLLGRDREPPIPLDEFRERFDEFPFDKFLGASLDSLNPDGSLGLEFRMITSMLGANRATVTITGTDKEEVQRIKTKVREEGEARIKIVREAQAKAAADADFRRQEAAVGIGDAAGEIFRAEAKREVDRQKAAQRKMQSQAPEKPAFEPKKVIQSGTERKPLWRRILDNDYTVEIVGGLIAAVIAGLIVAALASN